MNDLITTPDSERYGQALQIHNNIMANGIVAGNALAEVCKYLKIMRDEKLYKDLGYEKFEDYCEEKAGIKSRQAYTYISTYENLGQKVIAENAALGITKLNLLSDLNPVDRVEALESGDLAGKSVKEIEELIEKCNSQSEQLSLIMTEKNEVVDKLDDSESRITELEDALAVAKSENKKLSERPIEVSQKPSEADIEKLRADIKKEYDKDFKTKKDKLKAEAESAAAKKAEADKQAAIDEAVKAAKSEAEAAAAELKNSIEQYKNETARLEKQLKLSDTESQTAMIYFNAFQENLNRLIGTVAKMNDENKAKFNAAILAALKKIIEQIDGD